MDKHLREVAKSIKRLQGATTYLKRRNALRAFDKAVVALQKHIAREYPKLRRDGSTIVPRATRGTRYPACLVPMRTYSALAKHMIDKHPRNGHRDVCPTCFCGKKLRTTASLAKHLANVKDLRVHYGMSVLKQSAGVK